MNLTGQQVVNLLQQQFTAARILQISGLRFAWTDTGVPGPNGDTLVSVVRSDGSPLDLAASYTVTVNGFLAGGGDGFSVLLGGTTAWWVRSTSTAWSTTSSSCPSRSTR